MKILITGSTGLLGSALVARLEKDAHTIVRMVRDRQKVGPGHVYWSSEAPDPIDREALEGFDAVVHLAGETVAQRWSPERKHRIRNSRVQGTGILVQNFRELGHPPKVMLCASAIGYYGERGDEVVNEQSPRGKGFLSSVCRDWEDAALSYADTGARVVCMRLGVVLGRGGGALAKMLPPFRLGLGGVLGPGTQYMSWIHLQDVVGAIHYMLENEDLAGPVNLAAPNPVTNREFTRTLGKVLKRPTVFPLPGFLLQFAMGEMARETLLSSTRVEPAALVQAGFRFSFPQLRPALEDLITG